MSGIELQKILSRNVKICMMIRDINQRDLAEHIGISAATLSQKINGSLRWNINDIANASSYLQVKPETLLSARFVGPQGLEPWTDGFTPGMADAMQQSRSNRLTL